MSEPTTDNTKPIALALSGETNEQVVEKKSFFQRRVVAPIQKHPKLSIAVAAGLALVGTAALAGRKTAPSVDLSDDSIEIREIENGFEVVEVLDTTVA